LHVVYVNEGTTLLWVCGWGRGGGEGRREGGSQGKASMSGFLSRKDRDREMKKKDGREMEGPLCVRLKGVCTYHTTAGRGSKGGDSGIVVSSRGEGQEMGIYADDIRDGHQEDEEEDELQGAKHSQSKSGGCVCVCLRIMVR